VHHRLGVSILEDIHPDRHVIKLADAGWVIIHPLAERLKPESLLACTANWDEDTGLRGIFELAYEPEYENWSLGRRLDGEDD
jgi:hypothetical protein